MHGIWLVVELILHPGCPRCHCGFSSLFDKLKCVSGCHVENEGLDYSTHFQMDDPTWAEWIVCVHRTCFLFFSGQIKHYSWKCGDISKVIVNFCSFITWHASFLWVYFQESATGAGDGRTGWSFCDSFILETFLLLKTSPVALGQGRGRERDFILPRGRMSRLVGSSAWKKRRKWVVSEGLLPSQTQGTCTSRTKLCFTHGCPSASCGCTLSCKVFASPLVRVTFHMALLFKKKKNSCSQRAKISFSLKAWKGKEEIKTCVGHSNPLKMKRLIQNAEGELSFPISKKKKRNTPTKPIGASGLCF